MEITVISLTFVTGRLQGYCDNGGYKLSIIYKGFLSIPRLSTPILKNLDAYI